IKVDREERPDVDKIYMDAIHSLGEQGGWPLTMFLTPDGQPFWGGTYFPPESQYGRPGFKHVLAEIARIWNDEPDKVESNAAAITEALNRSTDQQQPGTLTTSLITEAADLIVKHVDHEHGGLRGAPKFPQTSTFEFLWRRYMRSGTPEYRQAVDITLTNICQGGIYDHLGGGFARYSVDHLWLAPHFEKMLYDNAQLITLLSKVAHHTGSALFRERIEETVAWLFSDMRAPQGAFADSYDADSEGEEGKFYVWSESEVDAALEPKIAAQFKAVYDVSSGGNWEHTNILNRLRSLEQLDQHTEDQLASARQTLFEIRKARVAPGWDDKVLSDWNGLTITALSTAGLMMSNDDWVAAASEAFTDILNHLWTDEILYHSYRDGKVSNHATAEGYANMITAAIALYQATGDRDRIAIAEALSAAMVKSHWDEAAGGFHFSSSLADNLIVRSKYAHDDATPNANSMMLAAYTDLHLLTGNAKYQEYARQLVAAFAANVQRVIVAHASFLTAFDQHANPVQAVLIGPTDDDQTRKLRLEVLRRHPALLIYCEDPGGLPAGHIAEGKVMIDGKPTLYLCIGQTCSLPVTDPEQIPATL
ncbi:MAG: thioredoxin domain-containing protein, partial [Aestuariivirgaceae bacterium]